MPELKVEGTMFDPILVVPVKAKRYKIPAMSVENAEYVQDVMTKAEQAAGGEIDPSEIIVADDYKQDDFITRILGDAYQEMRKDGLPMIAVKHMVAMAMVWNFDEGEGLKKAQDYYRAGGKVRAVRRAPQDRRPTATRTRTEEDTTTH